MSNEARLLTVAKHLLLGDDAATPEIVLRAALEATGADRGFVVARAGDEFEERFHVRFDRSMVSEDESKFSRSLVRRAIETRDVVHLANPFDDPRLATKDSVQALGLRTVLVVPLLGGDDVFGVLYLDKAGEDGFSKEAKGVVLELATLAAASLRRATEQEEMRRRVQNLERDLFARYDFAGIVTRDPKMLTLLGVVAQVADASATVLIRGETGTGKELVARALHVNSGRSKKPFVALHTTALPGTVLESELFGHVRGAFTGADRERAGRIASAHGGTLFLDEVAEIPLEVQAKLLRFLQFGEIQRLGSDKVEKVDVRIVAASHQDLGALVASGRFRQDLFFRLKVIELVIPPLRDRRGDLPMLVDHFFNKFWRRKGERAALTPAARKLLETHAWPGNVRELEHVVERASLLATSATVDVDLLPDDLRASPAATDAAASSFERFDNDELEAARAAAVRDVERAFLEGLMKKHGGNVSHAARESNIHRTYLQKLLARHRGGE